MGDAQNPPLSAQDRLRVFQMVSATDPALADRVSALLDDRDDPIVRLLVDQSAQQVQVQNAAAMNVAVALREVKDQMRQLMLVMTFVSIVAMCLNAALVGVSVNLSSRWGTFSTVGAGASGAGAGVGGPRTHAPNTESPDHPNTNPEP